MRITDVRAQVLAVRWVDYFGGESNVPHHLFYPSANFVSGRRREGQFTVLVTVETLDNWARLRVEDSGPGVPEQERDRVFDRFYRGPEVNVAGPPGSGLGLAIVRHIVQLHNARIALADSRFESGLAVTVDFPLARNPG